MRVYALMLGVALTTGYGYAAQVAVSSLGAGRNLITAPATTTTTDAGSSLDGVWYGGVLDPVTVEASGSTRAAAAMGRVESRPTVRCVESRSGRFRAVSWAPRGGFGPPL